MEAVGNTTHGPGPAADPLVLEGFVDVVRIASGGDSTIYRAHQPSLDRDVAIKVVTLSDPDDLRRFNREIALTVRLGRAHPNIVTVLDTRTLPDGRPCIVMDLFELGSTHDRLRSTGPFTSEEVVTIGRVIGDALAFAHAQRVVHRDVKPQNILIMPTSYVLADFGIARLVDSGHTASMERLSYRHASPEVLDGQSPEPTDDLWSLCSTLATLLEGRAPFASDDPQQDTALAYLRRVRGAQRRPLPEHVPAALVRLIARGMDPDRSRRYSRAEDLLADLRTLEREIISWAPAAPAGRAPAATPAATPAGDGDRSAPHRGATGTGPTPTGAGSDTDPQAAPDTDPDDSPTAPRVAHPETASRAGDLPPDSEDRLWAPGALPVPAAGPPVPSAGPPVPSGTAPSSAPGPAGLSPRIGDPGRASDDRSTGGTGGRPASADPAAPALSVAALLPAGPSSARPGAGDDAAPTGLRPPEEGPPLDGKADERASTPPRIRAGIVVLAVLLLLGSGVLAYLLTSAKGSAAPTQGQGTGVQQIEGVGGSTGSGGERTSVGVDLSDPDYIPDVLSVTFQNGTVRLMVRNPSAEGLSYIVFDVTDQDDRTQQGGDPVLLSPNPQPAAEGDTTMITVPFPAERCGQVVRLSVMGFDNTASNKGLGYSQRIKANC